MGMIERQVEDADVLQLLDKQGETLLKANIVEGETILVKLQGQADWGLGQAFVVTDRRLYILKYGWMTSHALGGQCGAYGFNQITGVEIRKQWAVGIIEVLTAADRNRQAEIAPQAVQQAWKADNMVQFQWKTQGAAFQLGVSIARETIQKALSARTPPVVEQQSAADEIEKLALLRDKGIVTEEEFQAKKRQLLGL